MSALASPVLVLNKNYQPIKETTAKSAFKLLMKGVAEVIDMAEGYAANYDFDSWFELSKLENEFRPYERTWISCVKMQLLVPTIIRLLKYDRVRALTGPRLSRKNIYRRDKNVCQYCGVRKKTEDLNLDHIIPNCQGGKTSWANTVCSCIACNTKKGGRTPKQAGMSLIRKPVKPKFFDFAPRVRHLDWQHFISDAYWNTQLKEE